MVDTKNHIDGLNLFVLSWAFWPLVNISWLATVLLITEGKNPGWGGGKLKAWLLGSWTGWGICWGLQLRPNAQHLVTVGRRKRNNLSFSSLYFIFKDMFNSCFYLMWRLFPWVEWWGVGHATFLPLLSSPRAGLQGRHIPMNVCWPNSDSL